MKTPILSRLLRCARASAWAAIAAHGVSLGAETGALPPLASDGVTVRAPVGTSEHDVDADPEVARWVARTGEKPTEVASWVGLGDAWMQRSRELPDSAILVGAESAYRRALALDPKHAPAMVGLAWVANTRHAFDEGRHWAREALKIDGATSQAHALLGDAAMEVGDYEEALEHFQAAMDARPDLSSYARSAHLLWLTGDARRAIALMTRAIQAGGPHPENTAWCRAELGTMYLRQGAVLAARQQLEKAMASAPRHPHVLAAMGRLHLTQKDFAQAITCYEKALAVAPQHGTLAALVDLYTWTGRKEEAEATTQRLFAFHAAHSHDSDSTSVPAPARTEGTGTGTGAKADHAHGPPSAELAKFLADQDRDLDFALAQAEEAYRTFRGVYAADALAWCYFKKGRWTDAARMIRKASKWNTPDASLFFHAGCIQDALGDRVAARKSLSQALALDPHFHPKQAEWAARKLAETELAATR